MRKEGRGKREAATVMAMVGIGCLLSTVGLCKVLSLSLSLPDSADLESLPLSSWVSVFYSNMHYTAMPEYHKYHLSRWKLSRTPSQFKTSSSPPRETGGTSINVEPEACLGWLAAFEVVFECESEE